MTRSMYAAWCGSPDWPVMATRGVLAVCAAPAAALHGKHSPQPNRICRNPCLCGAGYILLCTLFLALPFATKYPKAWLNRKTRLAQ